MGLTIQRPSQRQQVQPRSKMSMEYRWGWGPQGNIHSENQHDRFFVGVSIVLTMK